MKDKNGNSLIQQNMVPGNNGSDPVEFSVDLDKSIVFILLTLF